MSLAKHYKIIQSVVSVWQSIALIQFLPYSEGEFETSDMYNLSQMTTLGAHPDLMASTFVGLHGLA